jgi:hypothetical protein
VLIKLFAISEVKFAHIVVLVIEKGAVPVAKVEETCPANEAVYAAIGQFKSNLVLALLIVIGDSPCILE